VLFDDGDGEVAEFGELERCYEADWPAAGYKNVDISDVLLCTPHIVLRKAIIKDEEN